MVVVGDPLGFGLDILAPFLLLAGDVGAKHPTTSGTKTSKSHWQPTAEKSERD